MSVWRGCCGALMRLRWTLGLRRASFGSLVSESWRRSSEAGVDPGHPAPRMLDAKRTAERLAAHPVCALLPRVSGLLKEAMVESGYFAAFSDADGVLLWSEGSPRALRSAVAPRFLPGFLCSEDRIGTNAIGTALVLDAPVQIFSAEHFNQLSHGWTCAAAPVRDPDSGEVLGAIDLSGEFRTAHVHGLALVTVVATATEAWLAMLIGSPYVRRGAPDLREALVADPAGVRPG
jgi:transcriptional regulator of acetoin/glycerol metabolism